MAQKIVFFGTPEPSKNILEFLCADEKIEVVAVVTNEDKAVGRKKIMTPSPVKIFAIEKNIPVFTPEKFEENEVSSLQNFSADFFIIVAYGKLIPQSVIDIPQKGTFNLHFSLLPKYRGASPVQSSLLAGDEISGISIFELVKKMDAGNIFIQKEYEMFADNIQKNYVQVWGDMVEMGKKELKNIITSFSQYKGKKQDENLVSVCGKFTKSDGEIFPKKETAEHIIRKYNAFFLWPGIFLFDENGKRIKLLDISKSNEIFPEKILAGTLFIHEKKLFLVTQNGNIEIKKLQKEGKKPIEGKNMIQLFSKK